jgi:hypothetical protein
MNTCDTRRDGRTQNNASSTGVGSIAAVVGEVEDNMMREN